MLTLSVDGAERESVRITVPAEGETGRRFTTAVPDDIDELTVTLDVGGETASRTINVDGGTNASSADADGPGFTFGAGGGGLGGVLYAAYRRARTQHANGVADHGATNDDRDVDE
jgi:hypothetical protein